MINLTLQIILPFVLSALVVIIIMFIAEKYGTKMGGILGTLPSTIIVAYIFIALNKGVFFASDSVAVVPAEIGINLIFLFIFAILVKKSIYFAFLASFTAWVGLSFVLWAMDLKNIYISLSIFFTLMFFTAFTLEKIIKIKSFDQKIVHYTFKKIALRGVLAGTVIAITVLLSNVGEVISGIISVFPAIITSTMYISYYEHGADFASALAKTMIIGSLSVVSYAVSIHFFYPVYGIFFGSIAGFFISVIITLMILRFRKKLI